jgi:uncharacterized RDD family membrane protein YckC
MPVIEGTTSVKTAVGEYDFAVDGGAIGAITLRSSTINGNSIPPGSVVLYGYLEIDTLFTTGSAATMAISLEGANDLVAATVVSGAPYSTTGRKSVIPAATGLTSVKTTVARALVATIAVGTVTAGKGRVVVAYR